MLFCPSYCSLTFFLFCAPECQGLAIRADESKQRAPLLALIAGSSFALKFLSISSASPLSFLLLLLLLSLLLLLLLLLIPSSSNCALKFLSISPEFLLLSMCSGVPLAPLDSLMFFSCFSRAFRTSICSLALWRISCGVSHLGCLTAQGLVWSPLGVLFSCSSCFPPLFSLHFPRILHLFSLFFSVLQYRVSECPRACEFYSRRAPRYPVCACVRECAV